MKLKDIEKELKNKKELANKIEQQIEKLERKRIDFIVKNKLYETDFTKYIAKNFKHITLVLGDKSTWFLSPVICEVTEKGFFHSSGFHATIVYDEESEKYYYYHCLRYPINIIGFFDFEIRGDI